MSKNNTKLFGMIAGGLLIALTLYNVFTAIKAYNSNSYYSSFFTMYWQTMIVWAASVFLGVCLILDNIDLAKIPAGIRIVPLILSLIGSFGVLRYVDSPFLYVVARLFSVAGAVLLLIGLCIPGKQGSLFCFISAGLNFLSGPLSNLGIGGKVFYGFGGFLVSLLNAVPFVLIGLYVSGKTAKAASARPMPVAAGPAASMADAQSPIEKLTLLKGLLDRGIITQAEFDAKKAEILGQKQV